MDLKLQGQRVLVTGGSRGIGLAIAQAFAAEGAMPIIASRDGEQLAVAVKAIHSSTGITADSVPADLSQPGATEALFKAVGEVDVLVNNAGSIPRWLIARSGRAALAPGLGAQAVQLHQPHPRLFAHDGAARPGRDLQHHWSGWGGSAL